MFLPGLFGIANLVIVIAGKNKITREQLLNCALIIKYSLIPFYIVGGLCIVAALLMSFIPVPFMIFFGPAVAVILAVVGWFAMLGAAPYSIAYLVRSYKEGVHSKAMVIVAGILQFFFTVDVISMMVLALKEKKCIKTTITILVLLVIGGIVVIAAIAALIAKAVL